MFVDSATVLVRAGDGGNGIVSFRHERAVARGGPDGGDGGHGGNVIFIASNNQNTLANFRFQKELIAKTGGNGAFQKKHGRNGENLRVLIPVGTQIWKGEDLIADLTADTQEFIVARGGKGGFGNAHFTSSVRQAPKIAEKGEKGEEQEISLELKIIADVGLVGLPNAGKSTFLASVSSAKPKIANYPFTTLNPHLGVVGVAKGLELLVADIPGLIDGASEGKGLGDEFLRHVERTHVILHLIDAYSDDIGADYKTIINELANYKIDLSTKPQIIALTKIEGLDKDIVEDQQNILHKVAGSKTDIFAISSLSGENVEKVLFKLNDLVSKHREEQEKLEAETEKIPIIGIKPDVERWEIEEFGKKVIVRGIKIEKFASRTDFESEDGVRRLRDIMRKMGIIKQFEKRDIDYKSKVYFGDNKEDYLEY